MDAPFETQRIRSITSKYCVRARSGIGKVGLRTVHQQRRQQTRQVSTDPALSAIRRTQRLGQVSPNSVAL